MGKGKNFEGDGNENTSDACMVTEEYKSSNILTVSVTKLKTK